MFIDQRGPEIRLGIEPSEYQLGAAALLWGCLSQEALQRRQVSIGQPLDQRLLEDAAAAEQLNKIMVAATASDDPIETEIRMIETLTNAEYSADTSALVLNPRPSKIALSGLAHISSSGPLVNSGRRLSNMYSPSISQKLQIGVDIGTPERSLRRQARATRKQIIRTLAQAQAR